MDKSVAEIRTIIKIVQPLILVSVGEPSAAPKNVIAATKAVIEKENADVKIAEKKIAGLW